MSPFLLGAALALLAGALIALSARDSRWVLGGLVVCLGFAPLVADPLPSPIAVAARLVAAVLGAQLLIVALRGGRAATDGAPLGPVSIAFAAAAAGVVGYATAGVGSPAAGPAVATAAGFALVTLALGPLLLGRDVLRIGSATVLLLTAASLVRAGLAGTPGALEQGALAGVTIAILGATAILAAAALRAGHDLVVAGAAPRETLFEAHPSSAPARFTPSGRSVTRGLRRARAGAPRRDAGAHQLTLEDRLGRELPVPPATSSPPAETAAEEPAGAKGPEDASG